MMTLKFKSLIIKSITVSLFVIFYALHPYFELYAALIEPESALYQIIEKNKEISAFFAEIKVGVFDPEAFAPLNDETDKNLKPYEIAEQSFYQNVIFIRDEFLSIETVNQNRQTLHIYIKVIGDSYLSKNVALERTFSDEDIQFPYVIFFTKYVSSLTQELYQHEIVPSQLKYNYQSNSVLYQIGSNTNYLLIDPTSFKVLELQKEIQIQGRYYPFAIKFGDWDPQKETIPDVTRMYVNGRLFKEIRITGLQLTGVFTQRNSIIKKYQSLFTSQAPYSIETDYGQ